MKDGSKLCYLDIEAPLTREFKGDRYCNIYRACSTVAIALQD